jgi:membrane protein
VMNVLGEWHILKDAWLIVLLNITRYLVSFGSLMLTISIVYRLAPSHGRQNSFVNVGSIVASVLILASTYGFSFYLSRFSSYNKLYGSIGTMIALMIWLYLLAFVIILGFEINASIATAYRRKSQSRH